MKRMIAMILFAVILLGMIPGFPVQADSATATVETANEDLSVSGTNSIGNLISDGIRQTEIASAESENSASYGVTDISVVGNTATVDYYAMEEANLIVAIYTEDGRQLLASGHRVVSEEEKVAEVIIEGTMPQYFRVSAYLVDIYDYSPLCTAFQTPMYTQAMQELLSSSVDDYDQEKVLNLDEDPNTNFAVYTDDVVVIEGGNGVNSVVSIDYDHQKYVIENADKQVRSLTPGTIIAYPWAEGNVLIVKISRVSVTGTTVTLTGAEVTIEEVFSHMKLETQTQMEDAVVDTSTCADGVTYEGMKEEAAPPTRAFENDGILLSKSFQYNLEIGSEDPEIVDIKITGSLSHSLAVHLAYYISWTEQFVDIDVTTVTTVSAGFSESVKPVDIPLGQITIPTPITGVVIDCEPSLVVEVGVSITFNATLTCHFGFTYDDQTGFQVYAPGPKLTSNINMEGTLFFGIQMKFSAAVLDDDVASLGFSVAPGLEFKGTIYSEDLTLLPEKNPVEKHLCSECLALSCDFKVPFAIELCLLKVFTEKLPLFELSDHIFDSYKSSDPAYGGAGLGTCPNRGFRVIFEVTDESGNPMRNASLYGKNDELWGVTNGNGVLVTYLPKGLYEVTIVSDVKTENCMIEITGAGKYNLPKGDAELGALENEDIYLDAGVYASGNLGRVQWKLGYDGRLTVSGWGAIGDFKSERHTPWADYSDMITAVEIGDGVYRVGKNAFAWCLQLRTVRIGKDVTVIDQSAFYPCNSLTGIWVDGDNYFYCSDANGVLYDKSMTTLLQAPEKGIVGAYTIPDGVTTIGAHAFEGCRSMTSITLPDGLTTIDTYAFERCMNLEAITIPDSVTTIGEYAISWCDGLTGIWVDENNACYSNDAQGILYNKDKTTLIQAPGGIETCVIPDGVTTIADHAFYQCRSLNSVEIPGSAATIGNEAFEYCTRLAALTLGDGVTTIGWGAFSSCQYLTSLTIPGSVKEIGNSAFSYIFMLKEIKFTGDAPTFGYDVFSEVYATVYYPVGNDTWTSDVKWGHGGELTWVAYVAGVRSADDVWETAQPNYVPVNAADGKTRGVFGGEYDTDQTGTVPVKTASFQNLVPGGEYLLLAMVSTTVDEPLAASNLLYVNQAAAAEDGTLVFQYIQREDTGLSYVMVCGPTNKNLEDAVITFPAAFESEETQIIKPTVVYEGKTLKEGTDYTVLGSVDFTQAGTYTCYIRGIHQYTGLVTCTYTVLGRSAVTAWNLILKEDIGVRFLLSFCDEIKADENAYVEITVDSETEKFPIAHALEGVVVNVAPAQMTEKIGISVVSGDGTKDPVGTYSVRSYADYILAGDYDSETKMMVKYMLCYGAAAQKYFGCNEGDLADDGIPCDLAEVPAAEDTAVAVEGTAAGISFYGASLRYDNQIALRYYFTGSTDGLIFTANGKTYTPVAKDGMYYVEIAEILPQDLEQQITLTVADASGKTLSVSYSPMNYIVRMNQKGSTELKALVKALYNYHLAAKALA